MRREPAQLNRWLLIFDNAEVPRDIYPFLLQSGHTLITSRNSNWGALARSIDVQILPRKQAIEFLLKRVGVTSHPERSAEGAESKDAGELADELGCLPLALEQAGAYVEANGKTIAEYLQLYRARQRELLHDQNTKPLAYPAPVTTTWEISFNAIAAQSAASATLLNLLAFFAPDAIPREVISAGAEHLPESLQTVVRDELTFDAAVMPLRCHSLVQVGEGTFAMHRLVQTIVRDRLDDATRKTFAQAALNCLNDAFPFESDDVRTWVDCTRLYAHACAVKDETERLNIAPRETARLLNQVRLYQLQRAELAEAKTLFERAIKISEDALGSNHEVVAATGINLGEVLRNLGDLHGAKEGYECALKIGETNLGVIHPQVAIGVNNLGEVLRYLAICRRDNPNAHILWSMARFRHENHKMQSSPTDC